MRAPNHLSNDAKKVFRHLVKQLIELHQLHEVDIYQVERASVLIEHGRIIQSKLTPDLEVPEIEKVQKLMASNTSSLNTTLDKLGISYTKRNPYKEKRGRPVKGYKQDPGTKEESDWLKIINNTGKLDEAKAS